MGVISPEHMVQYIMQTIWKKRIWRNNRQQGFSLPEMLVVIAIIGLIAAIAVPSLLSMRERYKLRSSATDALSAIKRAKSEALRRDLPVAVAFTAAGYTVFVDDGTGGGGAYNLVQDGTEAVLFTQDLPAGNTFTNNTFPAFGGVQNIVFNPRGTPAFLGGQTSVGTIEIAGPAGSTVQYRITINLAGHVFLEVSTDSGTTFN